MKYTLLLLIFLLFEIYYATENEKIVWKFLKKEGLTDAGASGLMGNLQAESNMRSVLYENIYKPQFGSDQDYVDAVNNGTYTNFADDGIGFCLAQWSYPSRKEGLLELCKGKIGDLDCQLRYLMKELKNDFEEILAMLKTSTDLYACTIKVMTDFERTGEYEVLNQFRYQLAKNIYNEFSGSPIDDDENDGKTYRIQPGNTLSGNVEKLKILLKNYVN